MTVSSHERRKKWGEDWIAPYITCQINCNFNWGMRLNYLVINSMSQMLSTKLYFCWTHNMWPDIPVFQGKSQLCGNMGKGVVSGNVQVQNSAQIHCKKAQPTYPGYQSNCLVSIFTNRGSCELRAGQQWSTIIISFKVVTYYKLNVSNIVCMFNKMQEF